MWDYRYHQVHRLEHNYIWFRFIHLRTLHMRRKQNGTQGICGMQVAPPWLWRGDISIDGRFCSLWILTAKKGCRKSIFDASITVLLANCLYALVRKETPTMRLSFDLKLLSGFPCILGVGGEELLSPGWSDAWDVGLTVSGLIVLSSWEEGVLEKAKERNKHCSCEALIPTYVFAYTPFTPAPLYVLGGAGPRNSPLCSTPKNNKHTLYYYINGV